MATPNIVMTRIDERLVHGQGQLWIKSLGVNTVIVANDEAAGDKMAQTLMKTVIPATSPCASSRFRRRSTSSTRPLPSSAFSCS